MVLYDHDTNGVTRMRNLHLIFDSETANLKVNVRKAEEAAGENLLDLLHGLRLTDSRFGGTDPERTGKAAGITVKSNNGSPLYFIHLNTEAGTVVEVESSCLEVAER